MQLLGLNDTVDHLAMANSGHWYSHALEREDGNILRMTLMSKVEKPKEEVEAERGTKEEVEAERGTNEEVEAEQGTNEEVKAERGTT